MRKGYLYPYTVDVAYTDADGLEQTESLPDVEHLIGSAHDNILAGNRRDNDIDGGAGDDTLYGGPGGGDDVMAGGPGADVFVFGACDGTDTVTDFSIGTDEVDLTAFEVESVDDVTMTSGDDGVTVALTDIGGGTVLLADLTTLPDAGDFVV